MPDRPPCIWESPDGQTVISLSLEVVDAINAAIRESSASGPMRGAEIGGLLLGSVDNGTPLKTRIDSVELLPCHYQRGPSFHLETEGAPDLTRPEIVGYFRSHTRKDLFLSPDDLAVLSAHFARPNQVALLVKPFQSRANLGGFFVWRNGKMEGSASPREFSFHSGENPSRPPAQAIREVYKEEDDVPETVPAESRKQPPLLWAMMAVLALAAIASVGYMLFERTKPISRQATPTATTALKLSATEGDHNVTLMWDKDSTTVTSAFRAVIEIEEGTFQKTLELGAEQLRAGRIIYSRPAAIADTLSFSLRVFPERGKPVLESVQIISNRPLDLASQPLPALPPGPPVETAPPVEVVKKEQTKPIQARVLSTPKVQAAPNEGPKAETPKMELPKPEAPKVETAKPETLRPESPKPASPLVPLRPAPRRIP